MQTKVATLSRTGAFSANRTDSSRGEQSALFVSRRLGLRLGEARRSLIPALVERRYSAHLLNGNIAAGQVAVGRIAVANLNRKGIECARITIIGHIDIEADL